MEMQAGNDGIATLESGAIPIDDALITAIALALEYRHSSVPAAQRLQKCVHLQSLADTSLLIHALQTLFT